MKLRKVSNIFANILAFSCMLLNANNAIADSTNANEMQEINNKTEIENKNDNIGFTVFSVLVGEIALRNGQIGLSSDAWTNLALQSNSVAALERAVEIAVATNQIQRAMELTKQWLILEPTNKKATDIQLSILFLSKQFDDLLAVLQKRLVLLKNKPNEQKNIMLAVDKLLLKTNNLTNEALKKEIHKFVVELSKNYLDFAETNLLLAHSFIILDDNKNAEEYLKNAISIDKNNEQATILLAAIYSDSHIEEAEKLLNNFIQNNPNSNVARIALCKLLVLQKNFEKAYQESKNLFLQNKVSANFIYESAILAFSRNEHNGAIYLLTKLLQEDGIKNNALLTNFYIYSLAEIQSKNNAENQDNQAIENLHKVKYIDEENQQQFINTYKQSLLKLHNADDNNANILQQEVAINNKIFAAQENYINARILLAELLAKQNKVNEARTILQQTTINDYEKEKVVLIVSEAQIIANNSDDPNSQKQAYLFLKNTAKNKANKHFYNDADFLYQLAILAEQSNQSKESENLLKQLIKLYPDHMHGLNALGYYYVNKNIKTKFSLAEEYILKALKISNNKDPYIIDSLGWLYYQRGDFQQAYNTLKIAFDNTQDVEIGVHFLQVLRVLKNKSNHAMNVKKYSEEYNKVYEYLSNNFANNKIFIKFKKNKQNLVENR